MWSHGEDELSEASASENAIPIVRSTVNERRPKERRKGHLRGLGSEGRETRLVGLGAWAGGRPRPPEAGRG